MQVELYVVVFVSWFPIDTWEKTSVGSMEEYIKEGKGVVMAGFFFLG